MVAGAVVGTVVRYLTFAAWPAPGQVLTATVITVGLAAIVLGFVPATDRWRTVSSVVTGFAGAAASVSIIAALAISSSPLMCAAFVIATPISAIAGLALGLFAGTTARSEAHAVVDNV